jgi:AAA domain
LCDGAWLDGQQFPPLRYAVPGLIAAGLDIIAAPPKVGKSLLILDWLLAVVSGGLALSTIPCLERDVLLLALEDGDRRLQSDFGSCAGLISGGGGRGRWGGGGWSGLGGHGWCSRGTARQRQGWQGPSHRYVGVGWVRLGPGSRSAVRRAGLAFFCQMWQTGNMAKRQKVIEVDSRGRTNLAKVRSQAWDRYLVEESEDGVLMLTPAITITAAQAQAADLLAAAGSPGEARADSEGPWFPVVKRLSTVVRRCPHGGHTVYGEAQACGRQLCADAGESINHLFYLSSLD